MRVPHTIPRVVLRAYTRELDEEALKKSYEGRLLRSEDPSWDDKIRQPLSQRCLEQVIDEYVFYVKLVEELNVQKLQDHEKKHEQWELDLAEYLERKASYEQKIIDQEVEIARREIYGADPNAADDPDDDDDDDENPDGKPIRKVFKEPEKVSDTFPDFEPIKGVLDQLWDEDRILAVEELDFEYIPFDLAVANIPDDYYWERAALDRWPYADVDNHGGKWRRLFLEKNLWEAIESFHPIDGDFGELEKQMDLVAPEILRLQLDNLIPKCFGTPRKPIEDKIPDADFTPTGAAEDEGYGDGPEDMESQQEVNSRKSSEVDENGEEIPESEEMKLERKSSSHLDFGMIFPRLINLKEVNLVYEMQDTGLDWEPRLFQFTDEDCLNLAKAISLTPSLETFALNRSHVNDEQCKTLIREGLIKLSHLKSVNLNYNRIGDAGARAVARLLTDETSRCIHTIHTVHLARNKIHNTGGKALAWALTKNRHLTILDLRLNRLGDPAGRDFAHALAKNKSLLVLNLGANRLTDNAAAVFSKMLHHNRSLKELDLSSNDLGKKGGEHIALGIRSNKNVLRVDVRLANIGLDFEYDVGTHLRKNRNRIIGQYSLVERDDTYPPDAESQIINPEDAIDEEEFSDLEEEEEEDGEEEQQEELDDLLLDEDIKLPSLTPVVPVEPIEDPLALKVVKSPTEIKKSVVDFAT